MAEQDAPEKVRVSIGSAIVLGLTKGKLDAQPTTAYLLTYKEGKCSANCGFCPQARQSKSRADMLSRVVWPPFPTVNVVRGIGRAVNAGLIKRVCVQALNYPEVFSHIIQLVDAIRSTVKVPISVSCQPLTAAHMEKLAEAGVERIGVALDAATEELFEEIKGRKAGSPYSWNKHMNTLAEAVKIFGKNRVSTHLIVGLGETEMEMTRTIQCCVDMGVYPALFAFTPVPGTLLENREPPEIGSYRRLQLARFLIAEKLSRFEKMKFDEEGKITSFGAENQVLKNVIQTGKPFQTSGCPNCNRPYYNEKPSGPIYNFPRPLTKSEIESVKRELRLHT